MFQPIEKTTMSFRWTSSKLKNKLVMNGYSISMPIPMIKIKSLAKKYPSYFIDEMQHDLKIYLLLQIV